MNVAKVLDSLEIPYEDKGENAQGLCPMHERITGNPDHNPSWFIHLDTGQHICFSCGYKGNLQQLVCDVKEFYVSIWGQEVSGTTAYDYAAANAWLESAIEVTIDELKQKFQSISQFISPPPKPLPMSEARLAIYVSPPEEALFDRNLTEQSAEHYGVLWNKNTHTWILPLRDAQHATLMGWQEKGTVERTFKNRPAGLQKSKTLFGLAQQREDVAIVVESPLDCLRIHSAGIEGAVATCGAIVSEAQVKLLRYSGKIIAAFDNPNVDSAGKKACDQMRQYARKYGLNLYFFNYGDSGKKDPGDLTDAEIVWGIDNAKSALLGEAAYVYGNAQALSN
jgi:hypothetical protein